MDKTKPEFIPCAFVKPHFDSSSFAQDLNLWKYANVKLVNVSILDHLDINYGCEVVILIMKNISEQAGSDVVQWKLKVIIILA